MKRLPDGQIRAKRTKIQVARARSVNLTHFLAIVEQVDDDHMRVVAVGKVVASRIERAHSTVLVVISVNASC